MEQTITLKQMKQQAREAHVALKGNNTTSIVLTCKNMGSIHVRPSETTTKVAKKIQWADSRQKQRRK